MKKKNKYIYIYIYGQSHKTRDDEVPRDYKEQEVVGNIKS
jgi:hypothetical protein